jgi:N-acetylglucosaminyldiphosphoundecaprenol N-acetyl-beta-D-mannosaminyltransferase
MTTLLPRARLVDVIAGAAPLVGARCDPEAPRGFVSPVEARARLGLAYGDLAAEERTRLQGRGVARDLGVLAGAAAVRLVPKPPRGRTGRAFVVSATIDPLTIDEALHAIADPHQLGRARFVWFVHPHALTTAARTPDFARALERGDVVLPDGVGIRMAAALLGTPLPHNVNGTDLLPLLCAELARTKRPLSLVGGAPGVAAEAARRLAADHPGLVVGTVASGFLDDAATARLVAELATEDAPVILVGMGSPRQESFALEHLGDLAGATVVSVGGLFDFFSGRIPRAPTVLRELGLEWTYRLAQEPRRLAMRYLLGNPLFLSLALLQRLGVRRRPG